MADQEAPKCEDCGGQTVYYGQTKDALVYYCPTCNTNRRYIVYIQQPSFEKGQYIRRGGR